MKTYNEILKHIVSSNLLTGNKITVKLALTHRTLEFTSEVEIDETQDGVIDSIRLTTYPLICFNLNDIASITISRYNPGWTISLI